MSENEYMTGGPNKKLMKIKVIPAVGGGEPIELDVAETETAGELKKRVSVMRTPPLPVDTASLTFQGRAVADNQTMKDLGVKDGDKLFLVTNTQGGTIFGSE